ncbi:nucleic acid binding [Zea mays]
MDVRL